MNIKSRLMGAVLLICLPHMVGIGDEPVPVKWTLELGVFTGRSGSAVLKADIDEGWHIYSMSQASGGPSPTQIDILDKQRFALKGGILEPKPHTDFDPSLLMPLATHEKQVEFQLPLKEVDRNRTASDFKVRVTFQACNVKFCLPEQTLIIGLNKPRVNVK